MSWKEVAGLHSDIRWGTEKELTEEDRNADLVPDEAKIREEDQNLPGHQRRGSRL